MLKTPRKKQIDSALNNIPKREHSFLRYDAMQNILILFNYEDWADIRDVVDDMKKNGKHILLWTIAPKKKSKEVDALKEIPESTEVRVIGQKETSWYNGLNKAVKDEFENLKYDTLFDMTTDTDKNLLYLLASNSAQFCIGIKEGDHKIYDFVVLKEDSKSLFETYNQIKFYLNNIT